MDNGDIGQGVTEEQQNKGRVTLGRDLHHCAYELNWSALETH